MLESIDDQVPAPPGPEITDVANAIYDGTSAIMLTGETAAGKYPVEAVNRVDAELPEDRERYQPCEARRPDGRRADTRLSVAAATAHAACTTAQEIGADAILTVSQSGTTARLVSRFHPGTPIVACLLDQQVRRQMALYWGVEPIMMPYVDGAANIVQGEAVEITSGWSGGAIWWW